MTNTLHTAKTGMPMDTGTEREELYMLMHNDLGNFKLGKYYFLCIEW